MLTFFVVGLVVVVGVAALLMATGNSIAKADASAAAEQTKLLHNMEGFAPAVTYNGIPGSYGLALDPASEQLAILIPGHAPRLYHFTQLVAAEVERNGTTITTTKGKVSMGGAAVATALAGPIAGMLVGATTSSTSESEEWADLSLKVFVSDLYTPCFNVRFGGGVVSATDPVFRQVTDQLDAWYGRLRTVLSGVEQERARGPHAKAVTHTAPAPAPVMPSWGSRVFGA